MVVTEINDDVKKEMEELVSEEFGVNNFVCFMAGDGKMLKDSELIEVMDTVAKLGGVLMVHAENHEIVKEAERKMIMNGINGPEGLAMAHPEEAEVRHLVEHLKRKKEP